MNKRVVWLAVFLMVACACGVQAQRMSSGWYWPTGTGNFGGYLVWMGYNSGWGYHLAQDMKNSAGSPVYSIGSGTVISSGEHSGFGNNGSSTGGCVLARYQSADGTYFTAMYGHLDNYIGTGSVSAGQVVGYTLPDWNPPHLHFTIHPGYDQEATNPWRGYTSSKSTVYGFVEPMGFLNAHASGSAPSQPGVGISNPFPIDNTNAGTVTGPTYTVPYSPYGNGAGWNLLRGQLHCHKRSDLPLNQPAWMRPSIGEAELAQRYRNVGFDFVAVTDHNEVSGESIGWQGWAPHSDEITYNEGHVLATGTNAANADQLSSGSFSGSKVDRLVHRVNNAAVTYAGLAFLAHPDSVPYAVSPNEICTIFDRSNLDGVAIYNSSYPGTDSESTWDTVLRTGRRVWGYAEEDYHPYMPGVHTIGTAWVAVPGNDGEWWGNIKGQLHSGNYYSYWVTGGAWTESYDPPRLRVTTAQGTNGHPVITAEMQDAWGNAYSAGIYFKTGKAYGGGTGSSRTYDCNGTEGYVRVKVVKSLGGGRTLNIASQPILIGPPGAGYAPAIQSNRAGLQSTSPEMQVRYASADDLPSTPPPAGYIGQPVVVSADPGGVPSGATLDMSFDGVDLTPVGGSQYLAIYLYDPGANQWVSVHGDVDEATSIITAGVSSVGLYAISADLPDDAVAPVILIDSPPFAGVLNIDTALRATASDNIGVWRVSFYLNDHLVGEDTDSSDGWNVNFAVADYCTGDWTLKAVAEDLAGNAGTAEQPVYVFSSTPRPTVTISAPSTGSPLSGTVTASGTCGDDVSVAVVSLWLGDTLAGYATVDGSKWTCDIDTTMLVDGSRQLKAVVEDYPGNSAVASVGVVINNATALGSLGNARNAAIGTKVGFSGAIVVADSTTVPGAFYAESTDRACAVKVLTNKKVNVGDSVSVAGFVDVVDGERIITASDVLVLSSGNDLPKPLAIQGKLILSPPPDSIGKIVTIWGKLGAVDTANPIRWFMVKDASGIEIKCRLADGVAFDPNWTSLVITGVAVPESSGTDTNPLLLITPQGSVQSMDGP